MRPQKLTRKEIAAQTEQPAPQPSPQMTGPQFPWDEFITRLRVPCRTVWTYWELGTDFGSAPSAPRRGLFANIIKHLGWPGGSITFWPLSAEHQGILLPHVGHFWRGVREAQAETVFCFGRQAFDVLFPGEPHNFGIREKGGVSIYILPGPAEMLDGDMQAKRTAWAALKSYHFAD